MEFQSKISKVEKEIDEVDVWPIDDSIIVKDFKVDYLINFITEKV